MNMRLRELQRSDLAALNHWRNDRQVIEGLGTHFAFIGREVDEAWFNSYLANRQHNVRLAIIDEELSGDEEPLGCVYLLNITPIHRHAEFAIMIGREDCRGRGLGVRATTAMLNHAFNDLGLNRVWLHVHAENEVARNLYESIGFTHEGTLRAALFKNGQFLDVHVMGILADEWAARNPAA